MENLINKKTYDTNVIWDEDEKCVVRDFKAGAKWQKEQFEKDRLAAFVEKAEKWMKENFVNDQGLYCVITDYNTVKEMIEDFKNYMKGE